MTTRLHTSPLAALLYALREIHNDVNEIDDTIDEAGFDARDFDRESVREDVDEVIDALHEAAEYAQGVARQCRAAIKHASAYRKTLKTQRQMEKEIDATPVAVLRQRAAR